MKHIENAVQKGKIIGFFAGNQSSDPEFDKRKFSFEERKAKALKYLEYNLALYLILADENVYFQYADSFNRNVSVWKIDAQEYKNRLGRPLGKRVKEDDVYKREFEHASVTINLREREADILWN